MINKQIIIDIENNFIKIILHKDFSDLYFLFKECANKKKYNKIINLFKYNLINNEIDNIEIYECAFQIVINEYIKLIINLIEDNKFNFLYKKYKEDKDYKKLIKYIKKKIKCIKFDFYECKKKYLPKTIALLSLTLNFLTNDINIKDSFNFYWNNYPNEFLKFPIVDTKGSSIKTVLLLEKYYNLGFRYFIGFSNSTVLSYVLDWFNMHPDAIGISPSSTAPILNIPKSIFRMTPDDNYSLQSINNKLYLSPTVYYIYTGEQVAGINILKILETDTNINNLKTYPINNTNLTLENLKIFLKDSTELDSIILYIFDIEKYINLYSEGLTTPSQQYDLSGFPPNIPISASNELTNKYNIITFKGTQTSVLWRNGYNTFGENKYSFVSLNILQLLNYFVSDISIENINSHFSILEFDPVSKDLIYPTFLVETFIKDKYIKKFLYVNNPLLGKFNAVFNESIDNNSEVIKIKNTIKYKKPIALLELTKNTNLNDLIYRDSLQYFWFKNPDFENFPIIDTETNLEYTLLLLNKYYNEGYRIFLGFTRSTILLGVLSWFDNHPDAIGISLFSTAPTLKIKKNIYRLEYSDDLIINTIQSNLEKAETVYYIYSADEFASLNVLEILDNDPQINLKSYGIKKDNSNLTVNDLNIFFEGATENDVTVLYIFNEQKYFDLYSENPPLTFPGIQYDILNGSTKPAITGSAKDELNNKLIFIQNVSPNTSLLWRENAEYLTLKFKKETTSTALCNGLSMINYLKDGKNINLIASHSGVLQFDEITKDILYPSYLFSVYKKDVNNFIKESLFFDDPLLGKFDATFV